MLAGAGTWAKRKSLAVMGFLISYTKILSLAREVHMKGGNAPLDKTCGLNQRFLVQNSHSELGLGCLAWRGKESPGDAAV